MPAPKRTAHKKRRIVLSPLAVEDLSHIYEYTRATWGKRQAQVYLRAIEADMRALALEHVQGRLRADYPNRASSIGRGAT